MNKLAIAIGTSLLLATTVPVYAHETEDMKHSTSGVHCYGWGVRGNNMRMCYTNPEQTRGKLIIYVHGQWHEGEEEDVTDE